MNRLCRVTVDLRETPAFQKQFGDDAIREILDRQFDYIFERPDKDTVVSDLHGHVDEADEDDLAALLVDDTTGDGARDQVLVEKYPTIGDVLTMVYHTAAQWAWERVLTPDDDDIRLSLDDALEACKGTEMYGFLSETYWCGVLCSWPWAEITSDEEAVVAEVLSRAKVKGTTFTITYAGTKYARHLLRIRKRDDDDHRDERGDFTLGGNLAMELNVIARYVADAALKILERRNSSRVDSYGPSVRREDIEQLMQEQFSE